MHVCARWVQLTISGDEEEHVRSGRDEHLVLFPMRWVSGVWRCPQIDVAHGATTLGEGSGLSHYCSSWL